MRKLLILSFVAILAAGASGCTCNNNPCGGGMGGLDLFGGWRPGQLLFGRGNQQAIECCDPCLQAPIITTDPCCQ